MNPNFSLNADQTFSRVSSLYAKWQLKDYAKLFDVIIIQNGKDELKSKKLKTSAIHYWLFGVEIIDTLLIFTLKNVIIVASAKTISGLSKLIEKFKDSQWTLHLIEKSTKDNNETLKKVNELIESEYNTEKPLNFGYLIKEEQYGAFVDETNKLFLSVIPHEKKELAVFLQDVYLILSPSDLNFMRMSSQSACFFAKELINELENSIENEITITHKKLSEKMELKLASDHNQIKEKLGFHSENLDFAYTPIIQSGGNYDIRLTSESNDKPLSYDTILWNLGIKYMNFNSVIMRSIFINASKGQKQLYEKLYEIFNKTLESLKPGVLIKELYLQIVEDLKDASEMLFEKKPAFFGFGIGLEFKEVNLIINEKNENKLVDGMAIALVFSFNNLAIDGKNFAIQLADTVLIASKPEILTNSISRDYEQISYSLELEPSTNKENDRPNNKQKQAVKTAEKKVDKPQKSTASTMSASTSTTTGVTLGRTRSSRLEGNVSTTTINESVNSSLAQHQKELIEKKLEEFKKRLETDNFESLEEKTRTVNIEDLQCYKSIKEYPKELKSKEIFIDNKRYSILFPLENSHFPIHISLIKTVSKFVDNPYMYLRFNLYHPHEKFLPKELIFPQESPEFYFKELCFKSTDHYKMNNILKSVKELQKNFKIKGQVLETDETPENQTLKSQVLTKLSDIKFRPTITGRKTIGTLEMHENGFKFFSTKSETVEIFFNQIKQAFFQPCHHPTDSDYIIVIHFHCKTPVKVQNKLYDDVQVFIEAAGNAKDIGRNARGDSDEDDEDDEYERRKVMKLNREFEEFVKAVEKHSKGKLTFDIPFKELGFTGMPFKGLVFLQPTVRYLVNLVEKPFFVLNLDEVDFVSFERISGGLKNFDISFVFKDLGKSFVRISAIPKESFDSVKRWIDKMDLIFAESKLNMNWPLLIQGVKDDPKIFVEQGGWTALAEGSGEGEEDDDEGDDSSFDENEIDETEEESDDEEYEDEDEDDEDFNEEEELDDAELIDEEDEEFDDEELDDEESKKKRKTAAPAKKR